MELKKVRDLIEVYFKCDIAKRSNRYDTVKCRFLYYYMVFNYCNDYYTYEAVGKTIGYTHAAVINGLKEFEYIYDNDKYFKKHCNIVFDKFKTKTK